MSMEHVAWPAAWVAVISGIVLFLVGQELSSRQSRLGFRSRLGNLFTLIGVGALGIGLYGGFKGPITLGGITFEQFSFSHTVAQTNTEALSYARNNLQLTCLPAVGWRGGSQKVLEYTVKNNGNRRITRLTLQFATQNGSINLKLDGPFRPNQTTRAVIDVPPEVSRSYFGGSAGSVHQVVDAIF